MKISNILKCLIKKGSFEIFMKLFFIVKFFIKDITLCYIEQEASGNN